MATKKELSPKEQAFVEAYLTCWNGAEAARQAGYSAKTAREQASRLLTKAIIQEEIKRRLALTAMSADEVLERLAREGRGSIRPFLCADGETIDLTTPEAQASLELIKKFKVKKRMGGREDDRWTEVETEIELYDAQSAKVWLGKHHKLFTEKIDLDDSGLTDDARAERIAALLERARARRDRQADG